MSRVLIVEDEEAIADLEKDYLELSGFTVEIENNGTAGLKRALSEEFDMFILDLMLPGTDGFEICKKIREEKNTPILMVSAKKDDIDKIRGLGLGADDYITKPFSPSELVARVKAHLARYERLIGSSEAKNDIIEIRGIRIDKTARRVWVNDEEKQFTTKEFDLLTFLAEKECKADPYLAKLREVIRQISADKIASEGEERGQSYYIRKGVENMHLEEVAALLHRTDWAKDRTEELIRKSMENACPYGLFLSDCISEGGKDRQIGFARVLTDGVTTFYLMDLVIEEAYRGQGFGTIMMNQIMKENGHLYGMLHTQIAKAFYERYGFREIGNTKKTEEIYMEKPCG